MKEELMKNSEDILSLLYLAKQIGWKKMNKNSIQRIMYLLQVLYSFKHQGANIFGNFHFNTTLYGPYSSEIENSVSFLDSNEMIIVENGEIVLNAEQAYITKDEGKIVWMRNLLLILGKYGEKNVFALTINDPEYENTIMANKTTVLDSNNPQNETYLKLQEFKDCFEQTITDTSKIDDDEYLSMYFDYIFSHI